MGGIEDDFHPFEIDILDDRNSRSDPGWVVIGNCHLHDRFPRRDGNFLGHRLPSDRCLYGRQRIYSPETVFVVYQMSRAVRRPIEIRGIVLFGRFHQHVLHVAPG